jgi:broad specificity phosphatase PhoE
VKTLILMRHAESMFNERGVLNGDPSVPGGLTERGRRQATRAGVRLSDTQVDLCVTTNFQRSIETADTVLAGREVSRLVLEQLNDPPNGDFELRPYDELDEWQRINGPDAPLPGTGRTLRACFEDIRAGVALLAARPEPSVLAVIHGLALAWTLRSLRHVGLPDQAVPVFVHASDVEAMLDATAANVLSFWDGVS